MLNNLLTSLTSNTNGAISGVAGYGNTQANVANNANSSGTSSDGLFSQILNDVNLNNIGDVSDALIPDAQIGDGALASNNIQADLANNILSKDTAIISPEASNYISQVISNQPSIVAVDNANPIFVETPTEEVANITDLAQPKLNSLDSITKNSLPSVNQAGDGKADLSVVENIIPKNSTAKQDERILGQDNLESWAVSKKNDYLNKAIDIINNSTRNPFGLPQNALISEGQSKIQNDSGVTLNSSLYADGESLFNKHIDNTQAKISDTKSELANREINFEQNYKIASFSKGKNSIELHLEPAHLGKVNIKFDFSAEGKPAIMVLADKADTLDMLKKDSSEIQKILQDNGIKADSGSLSFNLNTGGNSQGYEAAQDNWSKNNSLFAFSLEQDFQNLDIETINDNNPSYISSAGAIYRGNLAYGMLNILV
ncbi:MAG: flagellar hook-length control protein FliK [Rickettsiales bacterium]|nr:flagellar hook-length control protein FliK [Rickettsiales bacterium]